MGEAQAVDAHHHVWDPRGRDHAWLGAAALAPLRRRFTVADHAAAAAGGVAGRPVTASVLVQTLADADETRDLLATAQAQPGVAGVVGWVDLTDPGAGDALDALREAPGGRWLCGVRHLVQDEPDPAWLERPEVLRGLTAVAERGLAYDALVHPHQLPAVVAVARHLPGLVVVLDHAGKPDLAGGDLRPWGRALRGLAAHPQVRCKVSGLVTQAGTTPWEGAALREAVDTVLEAFGPGRVAFGSDWPVCLLAASWARWAEALAAMLAPLSAGELDAVLRRTAVETYALQTHPPDDLPEAT